MSRHVTKGFDVPRRSPTRASADALSSSSETSSLGSSASSSSISSSPSAGSSRRRAAVGLTGPPVARSQHQVARRRNAVDIASSLESVADREAFATSPTVAAGPTALTGLLFQKPPSGSGVTFAADVSPQPVSAIALPANANSEATAAISYRSWRSNSSNNSDSSGGSSLSSSSVSSCDNDSTDCGHSSPDFSVISAHAVAGSSLPAPIVLALPPQNRQARPGESDTPNMRVLGSHSSGTGIAGVSDSSSVSGGVRSARSKKTKRRSRNRGIVHGSRRRAVAPLVAGANQGDRPKSKDERGASAPHRSSKTSRNSSSATTSSGSSLADLDAVADAQAIFRKKDDSMNTMPPLEGSASDVMSTKQKPRQYPAEADRGRVDVSGHFDSAVPSQGVSFFSRSHFHDASASAEKSSPRIFANAVHSSQVPDRNLSPASAATPERSVRLSWLFGEIEHEFSLLIRENSALKERIVELEEDVASLRQTFVFANFNSAAKGSNGQFVRAEVTSDVLNEKQAVPDDVRSPTARKAPSVPISSRLSTAKKAAKTKQETKKISTDPLVELPSVQPLGVFGNLDHGPFPGYAGMFPQAHADAVWNISVPKHASADVCPWGGAARASVAFASSSLDRTVKLWSAASPSPLFTIDTHHASVNAVKLHPTRRLVVIGRGDGVCQVFRIPPSACSSAASIPDNLIDFRKNADLNVGRSTSAGPWRPLLSTDTKVPLGFSANISTFQITKAEMKISQRSVMADVDWFCGAGAGKRTEECILTACWDGTIAVWDYANGANCLSTQSLVSCGANDSVVPTQCVANNDEASHARVLVAASDGIVRILDFRNKSKAAILLPSAYVANLLPGRSPSVALTKSPHTILSSCGTDGGSGINIWDIRHTRSPRSFLRCGADVGRFSVASHLPYLLAPCDDTYLRLFDFEAECVVGQFSMPPSPRSSEVRVGLCSAFSADSSCAVVGSASGQIVSFDLQPFLSSTSG